MTRSHKHLLRNRNLSRKKYNYYTRRPNVVRDMVNTIIRGESLMRLARRLIDDMFTKPQQQDLNTQLDHYVH
jgi:hypothetical protein